MSDSKKRQRKNINQHKDTIGALKGWEYESLDVAVQQCSMKKIVMYSLYSLVHDRWDKFEA